MVEHPPPYGAVRMQFHRNQGSIFQHFTDIHIMKPPLQKLLDQTQILHKETHFRKLQISEAISITCRRPSINIQQAADFIMPSTRPQVRDAPPMQPHQQEQDAPQPENQHPGPVTRSRSRLKAPRASTLLQDQVDHPPANSRPAQAANQDPGPLGVQAGLDYSRGLGVSDCRGIRASARRVCQWTIELCIPLWSGRIGDEDEVGDNAVGLHPIEWLPMKAVSFGNPDCEVLHSPCLSNVHLKELAMRTKESYAYSKLL
ncbi:hypothetical protein Pcinc_027588 [Petrolisthes cinctipes]|uniref:Uncharacterized protein n=1 Tax=Petrolisthes cinctipes TaxID=88211 RepID=A0AAE1KAL1_PETCI|nr:hypothetical protein Pcinc_027588 [Petrolisthes cinctipes]